MISYGKEKRAFSQNINVNENMRYNNMIEACFAKFSFLSLFLSHSFLRIHSRSTVRKSTVYIHVLKSSDLHFATIYF